MTQINNNGAAVKTPPSDIQDVRTLGQLGERILNVLVEIAPGRAVLRVALRIPSYHRWVELGEAIPDPPVPHTAHDGTKKVANYADTTYLRDRNRAANERMYRRLADALEGGGLTFTGSTIEAKAKELRETIAADAFAALYRFLSAQIDGSMAQLDTAAESFHSV